MLAATILPYQPHQLAAVVLFSYAGVMLLLWKRGPLPATPKPPQRVPSKPPQRVALPRKLHIVSVRPDAVLTFVDVDLKYCTEEELEYMMTLIVSSAKSLTLTDEEVRVFWAVHEELNLRRGKEDQ